jgi:hypothetical protein
VPLACGEARAARRIKVIVNDGMQLQKAAFHLALNVVQNTTLANETMKT